MAYMSKEGYEKLRADIKKLEEDVKSKRKKQTMAFK